MTNTKRPDLGPGMVERAVGYAVDFAIDPERPDRIRWRILAPATIVLAVAASVLALQVPRPDVAYAAIGVLFLVVIGALQLEGFFRGRG